MKHTEAEIDTVRQRVIDGERRIFAQLALVDWLATPGHATEDAEVHLKLMLNIVQRMRDHLREMSKDQRPDDVAVEPS